MNHVGNCLALLLAALLPTAAGAQIPYHKHRRPVHPSVVDSPPPSQTSGTIKVDLTAAHVLNRFFPNRAIGAGVDAIGVGGLPELFTASNVSTMLGAGLGALSYRLYTELNVQDWHWNPTGTWSDAANNQGYFVGSSNLGSAISESHGYALAHRGSTYDYGSNLQYSNLTDGNSSTYWKSNPYLMSAYTHDADSAHPQWAFLDLGAAKSVNAIKIQWANPYAVSYSVQYWTGDDPLYDPTNGSWVTFPSGQITNATGGTVTLKLATTGISAEYVRILMTQSSYTYDSHGASDPRNKSGYAIYEIGVGSLSATGVFTDYVVHTPSQTQTTVYVSSNDPWHTATSQVADTEQIGLDYMLQASLAQKINAMVPVPMLYSTPQNAVAEVEYLVKRHYPILGIELGEEPDGQWVTPEDEAALYLQWATAIHTAAPQLKLGGPVTSYNGVQTWADSSGDTDFLKRFYAYLSSHSATALLGFVSTEHYPFYQAPLNWSLVPQEIAQIDSIFSWVANAGIPKSVPVYVTEYNLSAAPDEPIVDLEGALWHAVFIGEFMNRGGAGAFYYQYFPYQVSSGGASYGLIGMLSANDDSQVLSKTSQYFSSKLIAQEWCLPGDRPHAVLPATSSIAGSAVLPYAVQRPDGQYAVMLVNTDTAVHTVTVSFTDTKTHYFTGAVTQSQFSAKDYVWISNGLNGIANPDGPIEQAGVKSGSAAVYTLPAHSITVLRGKIL